MTDGLDALLEAVRACRVCEAVLPLGARPVVQMQASARLLIISQAPGTRVHETGLPFDDRSGDRLRDWLGIDRATFYDPGRIAIMPMGFCYPGRLPHGGDAPPRPECAPLWHRRLRAALPQIGLTLLIGSYAQAGYLGGRRRATMGETVAAWRDTGPGLVALPHPSWRNTAWLKRNSWFETELLPELRQRIADLIGQT